MGRKSFIDKLDYIIDNYKKIKREIELDFQTRIIKDIKDICRTSIDMYYDAYTPNTYDRNESLYKAYKIKIQRDTLIIRFSSDFIPKVHRVDKVDPDYIYNMMFKEGWHGGALRYDLGVSTPYWRTPAPGFYEWGDRAVKSKAPYDIIKERFHNYSLKFAKRIMRNSSNKIFSKYL